MQNFNIDINKGRIEFVDNRFYATENGNYVPSVTTILEAYPKDAAFFKWLKDVGQDADTIRDEAGRRGSLVHELTEQYDQHQEVTFVNQYGKPKYKMLEWAMFERYVDFCNTQTPKMRMMEMHFSSDVLGFAGTVDRVLEINGKEYLVDIKTSNNMHESYWLQLAAYNELLKEYDYHVEGVAILWLNAKTRTAGKGGAIQGIGWQLLTRTLEDSAKDWETFQTTFSLWKSINEDIKPKRTSYQLTHQKNEG
jgi:hypothetical protein